MMKKRFLLSNWFDVIFLKLYKKNNHISYQLINGMPIITLTSKVVQIFSVNKELSWSKDSMKLKYVEDLDYYFPFLSKIYSLRLNY